MSADIFVGSGIPHTGAVFVRKTGLLEIMEDEGSYWVVMSCLNLSMAIRKNTHEGKILADEIKRAQERQSSGVDADYLMGLLLKNVDPSRFTSALVVALMSAEKKGKEEAIQDMRDTLRNVSRMLGRLGR